MPAMERPMPEKVLRAMLMRFCQVRSGSGLIEESRTRGMHLWSLLGTDREVTTMVRDRGEGVVSTKCKV